MANAFTGANDVVLTYWPTGPIGEQETSDVLRFKFDNPGAGSKLSARNVTEVEVWVRKRNVGSYVDISLSAFDMAAFPVGPIEMELYIKNVGPVPSILRMPIDIILGSSGPAGWNA